VSKQVKVIFFIHEQYRAYFENHLKTHYKVSTLFFLQSTVDVKEKKIHTVHSSNKDKRNWMFVGWMDELARYHEEEFMSKDSFFTRLL
jgi:hypothetical protein